MNGRNNKYCQGYYSLINPHKYKGTKPVYRSHPEFLMMKWFDTKDCIIEWNSETVVIPYLKPTDNRVHRYFIDFSCIFVDRQGKKTKYIIEYKPFKQTIAPVESARKSQKTMLTEKLNYAINCSKWKAATEYSNANGYKFLIVTEKDIA